jgi:acyl carrier protein
MTSLPAVEQCLTDFLTRIKKLPDALAPELTLYADGIGLDSLETAELSALLEDEFGSDPFNDTVDLPQTVGEILSFYQPAAAS